MDYKKIVLCVCALFLLFIVTSCNNDLISPEKENSKSNPQTSGTQTPDNHLTRADRPCASQCAMANGACHSNCGSDSSCHNQCEASYQNCLGYWSIIRLGTSICSVDKKINYLALGTRITLYLKTTNTLGFYGCDGTVWPEYGNRYNSSTIHERSFWIWQSGDMESWVNAEIAEHGYGVGC